VTVHVTIGTDTPAHPSGRHRRHRSVRTAISACSRRMSRNLNEGGFTSTWALPLVLPEVFLKAVSAVRTWATAGPLHPPRIRFPASIPGQRIQPPRDPGTARYTGSEVRNLDLAPRSRRGTVLGPRNPRVFEYLAHAASRCRDFSQSLGV